MTQLPAFAARFLGLLLSLLTLAACQKDEVPDPQLPPAPADSYVFPVRPGTPAWAAFTTGQQMVDACQVPTATLRSMSTAGLVYTCLDYPLLGDMLAGFTIQRGARGVMNSFNGFAELARRPEGAALLFARYQQMPPNYPNQVSTALIPSRSVTWRCFWRRTSTCGSFRFRSATRWRKRRCSSTPKSSATSRMCTAYLA